MSIYEEISKKLDELHEKIKPDNVDEWFDDVKRTLSLFLEGEKISQIRKTLEFIEDDFKKSGKYNDQLKKVQGIVYRLQKSEPDFLIERLKKLDVIAQKKKF